MVVPGIVRVYRTRGKGAIGDCGSVCVFKQTIFSTDTTTTAKCKQTVELSSPFAFREREEREESASERMRDYQTIDTQTGKQAQQVRCTAKPGDQ